MLMAVARQRAEWLRTGVMTARVCAAWGVPTSPMEVIPPQYRPPIRPAPPKSKEQIERENRQGWAVMGRVFSQSRKVIRPLTRTVTCQV